MKILIIPIVLAGLMFGAINIISEKGYEISEKKDLISDINIAKNIWKTNESTCYFSLKDNYITYDKGNIIADGSVIRCELKATSNIIKCYKRHTI